MKTYWNGQELDTSKEYKINTTKSVEGKDNPWYVKNLRYYPDYKSFAFKLSTINYEEYGMNEKIVVSIEEYK